MKSTTTRPPLTHRQRLLREGLRQFYSQGFHGTTVDALLAAAEAPKGSFYHHFGSKDEFAKEVVEQYGAATLKRLAAFATRAELDGMEKLLAYFHDLVERFDAAENRVGCLVGKFSTELAPSSTFFGKLLADAMDAWRDAIAAVMAEGQADGSIRKDLGVQALAHVILALIQGALTISLAHRTVDALREVEATIPKLLRPAGRSTRPA